MSRSSDSTKKTNERTTYGLEKTLAVLVVLTVVAVVAERPILETTLTLDASDAALAVYDDSVSGGNSESEILDPKETSWRCNLKEQAQYSFCGFEMIFDPHRRQKGLDLSRYDQIHLWLDYEGPTETVRVYLRNYDPAYSVPDRNDSTKYNQVEFSRERVEGDGPASFSMKDFFVANWWFQHNRLPPELTHPQFDNIVVLEVQTGQAPVAGEHRFSLSKVTFVGQLVSSEQWYFGIMATWVAVALGFLAFRIWRLKHEVTLKSRRERELVEVNRLLDRRGRSLEERARKDPLTGAFNREGIEEAIKEGLLAFRRNGEPLSLIFLDVDRFKAVNDNHGHGVGDQILSGLSSAVQKNIRTSDGFARWGGEEFALVCPNTGRAEATNLAEKLRALVDGERFGTPVPITVSFGVATLKEGEGVEQLFYRADEALYLAKELGRNRVEVAD